MILVLVVPQLSQSLESAWCFLGTDMSGCSYTVDYSFNRGIWFYFPWTNLTFYKTILCQFYLVHTSLKPCRYPSKHETLTQCWVNVDLSSSTLAQHQPSIGPTSRVCWDEPSSTQVKITKSLQCRVHHKLKHLHTVSCDLRHAISLRESRLDSTKCT